MEAITDKTFVVWQDSELLHEHGIGAVVSLGTGDIATKVHYCAGVSHERS